jgi:predicted transcriptional regulator
MQMAVITIRVPRELKEAMDKLDVNWSEEIRRFIARRVDEELRRRRLEEAIAILRGTGSVERGFAEKAVREDRDSR